MPTDSYPILCDPPPARAARPLTPKALRILHCIPGLGGGGAERQLSYLSQALTAKGVAVHIAYHLPGRKFDEFLSSGATFHRLASRGNHDPRLLGQLIKVIRRIRPHVIHTWLTQMDILGGLAALVTHTPFIVTERSTAEAYIHSQWKSGFRLRIGRRAHFIVANSAGGRDYWLARKYSVPVKIIPNAVVQHAAPAETIYPAAHGTPLNAEIVLFAGRFSAEKNLLMLLKALFIALPARPQAVAFLFGTGPLRAELLAFVQRNRMEHRIKILGYTRQLPAWMTAAKAFISISLFEGSPNVVCEAAALYCPLILSDIPPHRELLDENAAVFVPRDDPTGIAAGILEVLCHPEEAQRRAQIAFARVGHFTIGSIADQYLNLYHLVITTLFPATDDANIHGLETDVQPAAETTVNGISSRPQA